MRFKFETRQKVTTEFIRRNRNRLFLLGEAKKSMLAEPNVIGISTHRKPSMTKDPYFIDEEFDDNKAAIDRAFLEIRNHPSCTIIVMPITNFPGWSKMGRRAPRTLSYIASKISKLNRTLPD